MLETAWIWKIKNKYVGSYHLRLFQINYFNSYFFVKLLIKPANQESHQHSLQKFIRLW